MDANRFDAWTRRRFGRMAGGAATLLLGLGTLDDAKASKGKGGKNKVKDNDKRKHKHKHKEPACTSDADCLSGCMECADGVCGPKLEPLCAVCEESRCVDETQELACFPRCANGQVCCGTGCAEPCTNGCTLDPNTCNCDAPPSGSAYCPLADICRSNVCGDGQYFDLADCKCKCGADKVMCGGKCVSDVCESIFYFDQDTCTCACLNGGERCPTDDPRGACCYPTYVCYESTCYPPG